MGLGRETLLSSILESFNEIYEILDDLEAGTDTGHCIKLIREKCRDGGNSLIELESELLEIKESILLLMY